MHWKVCSLRNIRDVSWHLMKGGSKCSKWGEHLPFGEKISCTKITPGTILYCMLRNLMSRIRLEESPPFLKTMKYRNEKDFHRLFVIFSPIPIKTGKRRNVFPFPEKFTKWHISPKSAVEIHASMSFNRKMHSDIYLPECDVGAQHERGQQAAYHPI